MRGWDRTWVWKWVSLLGQDNMAYILGILGWERRLKPLIFGEKSRNRYDENKGTYSALKVSQFFL